MRDTFGRLIKTAQDYCIDDSTSSTTGLTDTSTFLKRELNNTVSVVQTKLKNYKTQPLPKTMTTVDGQVYYHKPASIMNIVSAKVTIGDRDYPLTVIHSQKKWDKLQSVDFPSFTIPTYIFPRRDDFGIYPTPTDANTLTLVGNFVPKRMTASDYTTGTIAITNGAVAVTGTDTTFTSSMVGRWLCITSDGEPSGNWYRIAGFSSTTIITLENYFEDTTVSGASFIIGESPELPEECHEFLPYKAAASFYATVRKDVEQAQRLLNYYYTGDFNNTERRGDLSGGMLGFISEYNNSGRGASGINYLHKSSSGNNNPFIEGWTTTLS